MLREIVSGSSASFDSGRGVLPTNVKPLHYDLTLEPDLEKCTYHGKVVIRLEVTEATSTIVLNIVDLKVLGAEVWDADGHILAASPIVTEDKDSETTTFDFCETFNRGRCIQLAIAFSGVLNDLSAGFYRSSYRSEDGSLKYMAASQMQPTDARRAFPCFDEPALKATFTIILIADQHLTCLSNMHERNRCEVQTSTSRKPKIARHFNATPLMSTYLVAFVVGELKVIESHHFRVPVRVYAAVDQNIELGRFSVDLAARTLAFYETTFGSKFPLPKMDMVAVADARGGMENWGLITYGVTALLLDEEASAAVAKKLIVEVVQHELAHQWFGNLVTMDSWEGLWLNEGFATWVACYACNVFYPEWKVWESFVGGELQDALSLDSLRSSHPIEVPVRRAADVGQIFDDITYKKGACVLRMVSKYLGEEVFLDGVRQYLKCHAYGNTKTTDLWLALNRVSGKDVRSLMKIWTTRVGYPVVTVTDDASTNTIRVKQTRFLQTADVGPEEDRTLYPVFLSICTREGIKELALMERERTFELADLSFYKVNADHTSLYRTFYSPERLKKLGEQVQAGLLSTEDRTGMVADAGALAASGYQRSSEVLALLLQFTNESEYTVWAQVLRWLETLRGAWIFESIETNAALKNFQLELTHAKVHEVGWHFKDGEDSNLQQFKTSMFLSAGLAGNGEVVGAAKDMFARFACGDRAAIDSNIRFGVFAIMLEYFGTTDTYNIILNECRTAETVPERDTAFQALGRARDPSLVQKSIDLAMGTEIRSSDTTKLLSGLRTHKAGIDALFAAMQKNWDKILRRFTIGLGRLGDIVQACTIGYTRSEQQKMVEAFFRGRSTKGFDQSLAQSLDAIRVKSQWLARDTEDVDSWLKSNGYH